MIIGGGYAPSCYFLYLNLYYYTEAVGESLSHISSNYAKKKTKGGDSMNIVIITIPDDINVFME